MQDLVPLGFGLLDENRIAAAATASKAQVSRFCFCCCLCRQFNTEFIGQSTPTEWDSTPEVGVFRPSGTQSLSACRRATQD